MTAVNERDVSLYINFVLHAVLGRMAEADSIMRMAAPSIARVADRLRAAHPIAPGPIYRGVLLDPAKPIAIDLAYTFMSWTEDRDVARWFGSCESIVSEPLASSDSTLRGFVLALDAAPSRILFHHAWRHAFGIPLEKLALGHPMMGDEGCEQIGWNLRTQHEVIIEPPDALPAATPIENLNGCSMVELDRKLTPPSTHSGFIVRLGAMP
mgnify:CR=1 FL=1